MDEHYQALATMRSLEALSGDKHRCGKSISWLGATKRVDELVEARAKFFAQLRNAKSWGELGDALGKKGFELIYSKDVFFAVNLDTGAMFELSECGHDSSVFIERLGSYQH